MDLKKRMIAITAAIVMLTGCARNTDRITVLSREEGSGTRDAFVALFSLLETDHEGRVMDSITDHAEINHSTAVMLTTVAGNRNAIGYVSLGSLSDAVKPLRIDGALPDTETVESGEYTIFRSFGLVTKGTTDALTQDFMAFLLSEEGQAVVKQAGYVRVSEGEPYRGGEAVGELLVVGSSSVAPMMERLAAAYEKRNPRAGIKIQQNDSTTGIASVIGGECDIGMTSRDLKDSERAKGATSVPFARDGIAVIVHRDNPISELSRDEVRAVFSGDVTSWSDVR